MIDTQEALTSAIRRAMEGACVALDTEFLWDRTYYPQLALVQIGYPDGDTVLIDPFLCSDLIPLGRLLESVNTAKILHSSGHDLAILCRETQAQPRNIFDTQIAAGFVGLPSNLSLARLLKNLLHVNLRKAERNSDWSQRPLTDAQMEYARWDVLYLIAAMNELRRRAEAYKRSEWVEEEMARHEHPLRHGSDDPWSYYLRIKAGRKLSPRQRTVLQHLANWRECTARDQNIVRSAVLSDKELVLLARRLPRTERKIASIRQLNPEAIRRRSRAIFKALEDGMAADLCPPAPSGATVDRAAIARSQLLEAYVAGRGLSSGIDPVLIAGRADIRTFIARPEDETLALRRGWRWKFVGAELAEILSGLRCVTINPELGLPCAPT